jgi:hypothetical protein
MPGSGGEINSLMDLVQPPAALPPGTKMSDLFVPESLWVMAGGGTGGGPDDNFNQRLQAVLDAEATIPNVNYAGMMGAKALPKVQSSEGGWFPGAWAGGSGISMGEQEPLSIEKTRQQMTGVGGFPMGGPPQGMRDPSTNNWRLLPRGFNNPNWMMRNGEIIDKRIFNNIGSWAGWAGVTPQETSLNRIGGAYPINAASSYGGHGGWVGGGWPGSTLGMHGVIGQWE